MNINIDDLLNHVKTYNQKEIDIIKKSYNYADYIHEVQTRKSGDPYITHPLNIAYILLKMHADRDTICASLLQNTLEYTKVTKEEIVELFNKDITNLVDGVTKISKINFSSKAEKNLANTEYAKEKLKIKRR